MIKGSNRKMIMLNMPRDSYFESAFFVLKNSAHVECFSEDALLAEANKMISENTKKRSGEHAKKLFRSVLFFIAGVVSGTGGACLVFLLF